MIKPNKKSAIKSIFSTIMCGGVLFLVGCPRVDIKDGQIPAQYMPEAQKLAGLYSGEFDRKEGVIEISYIGNRPVVKFLDDKDLAESKDLLYEGCQSSIQQIKSIDVDKVRASGSNGQEKYRLNGADFVFSPGQCKDEVLGKVLYLNFSKDYKVIRVELLERYEEQCRWSAPGTYPGGGNGNTICNSTPVFLKGRFVKIN